MSSDSQRTRSADEITGILVGLKVEGEDSLFVLFGSDGLINRLGTGAVNNTERDMFIGKSTEPLFEKIRSQVNPNWFSRAGSYTLPERRGKDCELTLLFRFQGNDETGIRFTYGSESEGPPGDIRQFVVSAVQLTDPWLERQKRPIQKPKRPWWKLW